MSLTDESCRPDMENDYHSPNDVHLFTFFTLMWLQNKFSAFDRGVNIKYMFSVKENCCRSGFYKKNSY